jgi:hypothetical protein
MVVDVVVGNFGTCQAGHRAHDAQGREEGAAKAGARRRAGADFVKFRFRRKVFLTKVLSAIIWTK